jgi:outer membrane protein assembly factor BamB
MVMMTDQQRGVLGLFELPAGGEKLLERRWERPFGVSPIVVRMDEQRVLVYLEEDEGRFFESINATSGRTVWRIGPVNAIAAPAQDPRLARGNTAGINTALDGWRPADDLVMAMDTQTLVLVQRSGLAFATSLDDGELLWRTQLPLDRVVDVDVADGVLTIVGDQAVQPRRAVPRLLVFDARSGETLHQLGEGTNFFRWVKMTEQGVVLAGVEGGIMAMRARSGEEIWTAREPIMAGTFGAWVFDDRVLVLGQGGDLLVGDVTTGRFTGPLAGREDRQESGQLSAWRDENRLIVASELGVRIFGVDGRPIATDALDGSSRLVMPTPGVGVALMAEQLAVRSASSPRAGYRVRLLDTANGRLLDTKRLEIPEAPLDAALLDGVMLLSTPGITVVMPLETK